MRPVPALLPALFLLAPALPGQSPRPVVDLTPASTQGISGPAVASDQDLSAVLYLDGADQGVYVRVSDGHGLAWSTAVRIDSDATAAAKSVAGHSLRVEGDSVYCSWRDSRLSTGATPQDDTWFAVSHDRGATWSADLVLPKGHPHGPAHGVTQARLAVDGGRIHVGQRVDNGNDELWIASSTDGGATWTALKASSSPADVDDFALDASAGGVFVAWSDDRNAAALDDLWFRASMDAGQSWSAPEVQLDGSGAGVGDVEDAILLMANGSQLSLAWLEDELPSSALDEELRFRHSPDLGASWSLERVLQSGADTDRPSMSFCGCNVSIAWEDDRGGADQIYAAVSVDQGASWSENQLSTAGGAEPRIGGRADFQGVVWTSGAAPDRVWMAVTRDEGLAWLPPVELSPAQTGDADFAELAFNEKYKNHIAAWQADDSGADHLYAGGLRTAAVLPQGNFTPGGAVSFGVERFPIDEDGMSFGVLVAGAPGSFVLPFAGAYQLGLANDAYLQATMGMIPGPLMGSLNAGAGSTSTLTVPAAVPSGSTLYAAAVSFALPGPVLRTITEVVAIPVL